MHIVHITPSAIFESGNRGGGPRYVNEYLSALARQGSSDEFQLFAIPNIATVREIINPTSESLSESFPTSKRQLHASLKAADIVHVHHLNSPGFDHAFFASFRGGPPIVLSDHGGGYYNPGRALGRLRNARLQGFAAVSQWSLRDIDPHGLIRNAAVVYGGGDHILRTPARNDPRYETEFLFVGRLLPHKGVHVAIEALPKNARLVVAGETRDVDYFAYLRGLAVGKDIEFIGSPDDALLPTLYRSARFCVLPTVESYKAKRFTRPELLGLVVLEAMACGTPVIGSRTGGLAEVLEMAGQHSAQPGDVASWHSAMTSALDGPRVEPPSIFTWDAAAKATYELYFRVMGEL